MNLSVTLRINWIIALLLFTSGSALGLEPGFLTGKVTDSSGKPLPNVTVFADNTLLYNTNATGVTDANGNYRINVSRPVGTWHATAQLKRQIQGKTYTFDLHPNDDNPFAGNQGAVRNFTWKLHGQRPDGGRYYGSSVIAYGALDNPFYIDTSNVELLLEPVTPLADGSVGKPIVSRLQSTADGSAVVDVPLARYKVSARYLDPEQGQIPLWVRLRNEGDYQPSLTTDFKTVMSSIHHIEVEVRTP